MKDSGPTPPLKRGEATCLAARQASMLARDYMLNARSDVDEIFGAGYAEAHPELVGACVQAARACSPTRSTACMTVCAAIVRCRERRSPASPRRLNPSPKRGL